MEGKEKGRGKTVGQFGSTKNSTLSISYVYRPPLSLLSSLLATFIGHQRGFNLSIRGGHRCQRHLFSRFWTRLRSLSRLNDTDAYRFNLYHRFFWTENFRFFFLPLVSQGLEIQIPDYQGLSFLSPFLDVSWRKSIFTTVVIIRKFVSFLVWY